jgi:hypothetical protein
MRHWLCLLLVCLLTGCALPEPLPTPAHAPMSSFMLAAACEQPVVARAGLARDFRYGCFCGQNHPRIQHPSGRSGSSLSASERDELVTQFLALEPWDDLDAACRQHDICWIRHGQRHISCNRDFAIELMRLHESWKPWHQRPDKGPKPTEYRCSWLARDMLAASLAVMKSESPDRDQVLRDRLAKLLMSPASLLYGAMVALHGALLDNYPAPGEQCRAPDPLLLMIKV